MAVIDLLSGKVSQDAPDIAAQLPELQAAQPKPGGVIDLDTGKFVQEAPVEQAPAVSLASSLEELGASPQFNELSIPSFLASVGAMFTFQDKEVGDILKEQFPGTEIAADERGDLVATFPDGGQFAINKPGISGQDIAKFIGTIGAFTPAAKGATLGTALGAKVAAGAVGAGVTETAIQAGQAALGGQVDPGDIALSAVLGGAAEAVVPAIQGFRQTRQARKIGAAADELAQVAPTVQTAREATEATGVPLFQAQQTGVPAQLEKQSFVAQLPAGTRSAVEGLKTQNKAAGDAVEDFINTIAPPEAVITGAERFRGAAQAAVDKAKNIRAEKTSPLYKDALNAGGDVDLTPFNEFIRLELKDLPASGEIAKTLKKVSQLTKAKGDPSLRLLHNAKVEIDQMINKFGENSLGNTTKGKVTEAKNILLDQMDLASEGYTAARQAFADASPGVTKIKDSIVGKIAALDDIQLKQISGKIFDPAQTNPQVIAKAKKAITDVDPDAWSQLIRVELERSLGAIKSTAEAGTVENIPGQLFRALFPNDKSTKVLMNALDDTQKKNLKFLQTALGRARLGRPGGSQTAAREEIKAELRGGVVQSVRDFFKAPISTLVSTGDEAAFNRRTAAMAKALFDPTWKAEMAAIRKLNPNSPAAARAMTQLLNDIEFIEGEQ